MMDYENKFRRVRGWTPGDAATLSGPVVAFLLLSWNYFEFVLDDQYITLRYAEHLAAGKGLVWNVGASQAAWTDPVEGYTSTLWVLMGAILHWIGINPVLFMKVLSIGAVLAVLVTIFLFGKYNEVGNSLLAPLCATIGFSPAVALISVQGMETAIAMAFVCAASVSSLLLLERGGRMWVVMLYVSLLLAVVTRPGLVVFGAGLLVSLFAILARREGLDRAIRFTLYGVVLLFVPGVVFLVSRYAYFGYWFPNSFYVKASSGVVSVVGAKTVFEFLTIVVGPVSFVGLLAVLSRPASSEIRDRFVRVGPILTGTALFLGLWFFIDPLQGFLWRFQLPVLPAILLSVASVSRGYSVPFPRVPVATFFVVLAVLGMTVLPLHTFDDAGANADRRDQTDRVIAGESLRHLNSDYRMFVTESGALPYYSGWVAVDELGLNSEYVAHNGLSRTFLSDYDPDLVMVRVDGGPNMLRSRSPVTAGYLANGSYRLVAAVDKSGGVPNGYHLYFVDIDSKGYDEIACTLLTMDGVEYVDRKYFVEASGIDVRKSEHTSQACR